MGIGPLPLTLLLNGRPFSWNSLKVWFGIYQITPGRLVSINWNRELETDAVVDGDNIVIDTTAGALKAAADGEFIVDEYERLLALLGFGGANFDATIMLDEIGRSPLVYTLKTCRFIKEDNKASRGPEAQKTAFGLSCSNILRSSQIISVDIGVGF